MDRYVRFAGTAPGRMLLRRFGLPTPVRLIRYSPSSSSDGPVLVGGAGRLDLSNLAQGEAPYHALVFDATGVTGPVGLRAVYDFFAPVIRSVRPGGRVIVLGTPPGMCGAPGEAAAQRALSGFVRSVGKELGQGSTANLVYVAPDAEPGTTLRFLLSSRSAYVSGQVVTVRALSGQSPPAPPGLAGRVAVVTGAARGIGAAVTAVLAREGATVVAVDLPGLGAELSTVANDVRGTAVQLDLTAPNAPERLERLLDRRFGRLDILVHNAGITRDRTLAKMTPDEWDCVVAVNLTSQQRITEAVVDLVPEGGRIVCVSSVAGIAGNRGQANYAAAKAGVIGLVQAFAPRLARRGVAVNAVAPGFIETGMTAAMPFAPRLAGRRLNSLGQGGEPVDVAETIAWLAEPGSGGVAGNVIRVCGQSLLGA
jgi:3-oxoacyl-[acyl-carrier protein] reductase